MSFVAAYTENIFGMIFVFGKRMWVDRFSVIIGQHHACCRCLRKLVLIVTAEAKLLVNLCLFKLLRGFTTVHIHMGIGKGIAVDVAG